MRALKLSVVEICPWALREGILLRRLSPLLTPDSLYQIKLLKAAADQTWRGWTTTASRPARVCRRVPWEPDADCAH